MPEKCPQCGKTSLWTNKGVSKKTGKPYENRKCSAEDCDYIKWIPTNGAKQNGNSNEIIRRLQSIEWKIDVLMQCQEDKPEVQGEYSHGE